MEPTILTPNQFLLEVARWGVNPQSLIRVRMMILKENVYCKFHVPHTSEVILTIIPSVKFYEFDFMNIIPISTPATWKINSPDKSISLLVDLITNANRPKNN